jgi:hypothetical protein
MATPVVTPDPDPVLDRGYGMHSVEPMKTPPISRNMQFDEFAPPEVPAALETPQSTPQATAPEPTPPTVPPPTPAPAQVTPETTPTVQATPPTPPVPTTPIKVESVIDLGDGTGVQRFVGEGPDELSAYKDLNQKLTKAQEHATRKIAQQRNQLRARPERELNVKPIPFVPRQVTEADIAQIKELWDKNPVEAWRRLHDINYGGIQPETMVEGVNSTKLQEVRRIADEAAVEFIADHEDDFEPSPQNSSKIHKFLYGCTRSFDADAENLIDCKKCGKRHEPSLPVTRQNLEYAYQELSANGENFAKAPEPAVAAPPPQPTVPVVTQVQPPPPAPVVPQVQAREVPPPPVVISDRSGQRPVETTSGLEGVDVAALNKLPPQEMKARIEQIFRSQRTGGR